MRQVLDAIFNTDFSKAKNAAAFHKRFFARELSLADLKIVCDAVLENSITIGGHTVQAAIHIKGKKSDTPPFAILAQLHGNEPAGLAGILLVMALEQAGKLERDVIVAIGNPLAASQYFKAWAENPRARQESRDAYRCGLEDGKLLPDGNRIPIDFMTRPPVDAHTRRAQELYILGQHISGILDIHSARGNMVCITDHKRNQDLRGSPIRSVLTNLAEAISAQASKDVTVQTLKTILAPLPNIECQIGIEAGRHETPEAPLIASSYTLSLLHTLGISKVAPLENEEDGLFENCSVRPRLTYGELVRAGELRADDKIYMAVACTSPNDIPPRSSQVAVRKKDGSFALQTILNFIIQPAGELAFALYQFDELEEINKGDVVAVALPSGTVFKAPSSFSGIFFSKAAYLYDKDPSVGPWPVDKDKMFNVKFCYPCDVSEWKIKF